MKKLLLLFVGALLAMPSMAQDEDVTYLVQNAGFDEDLTFQVNGGMKEAISTETTLSERSWAYIAADSTVYARPKSTSSQNRPDGRKMEAVNGFKGRIKGWTMESNSEFPKCEWTYFGSVPYDLVSQSVPIADDGTTYLEVPQRPTEFDGGEGFVYLRAGWTNSAIYKQVVKLPCAVYRLEYWTININPNTSAVAADLTQIQCRKEIFKDEESTGLNAKVWTKHEFEFTPTAEFTMQFGYQAANAGSGGQPIVALDGIKLYKIGEADPIELMQSDISDLQEECSELQMTASSARFNGLYYQMDAFYEFLEDAYDLDSPEEMQAAINYANEMMAKFRQAIEAMDGINAMIERIDNLIATTDYPAKDVLQQAWEDLNELKNGDDEETDYAALMIAAVDRAKLAIKEYMMSQKETASEENPADFTFLIQHPWFINEDAEPVMRDGKWYFPKQFDAEGNNLYSEGSASSPDLNSEGWIMTGTYTVTGQQRLNWQRGRSCWNAWGSPITGTIAVGQTIENLPNGYYTVSADLICQPEYQNDQHVYAQSTTAKIISSDNISAHEINYNDSIWATISMTNEEKVIVVDGKLTIGAEGTGNGIDQTGWFLATNFRLNFLGEASEEAIAAALKESFDAHMAEAKEMAGTMHFAADKKALNDSIAKYEGAADKDAYIEALTAIQNALKEAEQSEAKYYEYLPSQQTIEESEDPDGLISSKTLLWVQALLNDEDVIDHEPFTEATKPIAQFALDYVNSYIVCDTATYKQFDNVVNLLKNYVNTYIPAYNDAAYELYNANEKGRAALQNLMDAQKSKLISEMKSKETVDAYVKELKDMIAKIEKQNIFEDPSATDYTTFIINPNAEAVDGWDITIGNGDGNGEKSGQWMDDSSTRYFDSYNSGGLKGFKFSQLISDLPNGTYNVGVYTRTPAEGAYVFYALQSDTTFVEIPLDYWQTYTEAGEDTIVVASDNHGPIWEAAREKVEAGTADDWDEAVYNANFDSETGEGRGRGWKHQEMNNIKVENHELLIGSMTGTAESQTEKVFAGAWYSVGGWTLTLVQMGDNTGWSGPIEAGIATILTDSTVADGIYTLSGVKVNSLQRGVNIIITNGNVRKVMVK